MSLFWGDCLSNSSEKIAEIAVLLYLENVLVH